MSKLNTRKFMTDKEFKAFKKDFQNQKAQELIDERTKTAVKSLLFMIGELQSERDELKSELNNLKALQGTLKVSKFQANEKVVSNIGNNDLFQMIRGRKFFDKWLNDLLFLELKSGLLYA